jgi:hypothetical protein
MKLYAKRLVKAAKQSRSFPIIEIQQRTLTLASFMGFVGET